eukprot:TRINITY_DN10648_c0_g1_i2.p1 TRINITY_DN10648_c0_g1~~TRINITY_DN10648_c0_g1_i2.p1  ORF type:complete len:487 (-),score=121.35 TRINITY_DN10648_c0_g1_i2:1097-2557(-)
MCYMGSRRKGQAPISVKPQATTTAALLVSTKSTANSPSPFSSGAAVPQASMGKKVKKKMPSHGLGTPAVPLPLLLLPPLPLPTPASAALLPTATAKVKRGSKKKTTTKKHNSTPKKKKKKDVINSTNSNGASGDEKHLAKCGFENRNGTACQRTAACPFHSHLRAALEAQQAFEASAISETTSESTVPAISSSRAPSPPSALAIIGGKKGDRRSRRVSGDYYGTSHDPSGPFGLDPESLRRQLLKANRDFAPIQPAVDSSQASELQPQSLLQPLLPTAVLPISPFSFPSMNMGTTDILRAFPTPPASIPASRSPSKRKREASLFTSLASSTTATTSTAMTPAEFTQLLTAGKLPIPSKTPIPSPSNTIATQQSISTPSTVATALLDPLRPSPFSAPISSAQFHSLLPPPSSVFAPHTQLPDIIIREEADSVLEPPLKKAKTSNKKNTTNQENFSTVNLSSNNGDVENEIDIKICGGTKAIGDACGF